MSEGRDRMAWENMSDTQKISSDARMELEPEEIELVKNCELVLSYEPERNLEVVSGTIKGKKVRLTGPGIKENYTADDFKGVIEGVALTSSEAMRLHERYKNIAFYQSKENQAAIEGKQKAESPSADL